MSVMNFFAAPEKGRKDTESERTCFQATATRRGHCSFRTKARKGQLGDNVELCMWEKDGEGHNHHKLTFGPFCLGFLPYGDGLENKKRRRWIMFRGSGRGGATTRVSKRVFERVCSVRDHALPYRTKRRSVV